MTTQIVRDTYDRFDEMCWKEKELVHQRVSWLLASQSLLVAAYGVMSAKKIEIISGHAMQSSSVSGTSSTLSTAQVEVKQAVQELHGTILGVSFFGLVMSVALFLGVFAAVRAHKYWQKSIDELAIDDADKSQFPLRAREGRDRRRTAGLAYVASLTVPAAFVLLWAYLIVRSMV